MIKLYQQSSTGKIKFLELWTEGANFFTKWGLLGHKEQVTKKKCKAMNVGKANELSPEEQAIAEMKAKVTLKMKEGYSKTKPKTGTVKKAKLTPTKIKLSALPTGFCPNKPISEAPKKVLESSSTYGQRKFNGHCILLVRDELGNSKVYSRRMEDITERAKVILDINEALMRIPKGAFILCEFTCRRKSDGIEITRHVATLLRTESSKEVYEKYVELLKQHSFELFAFDIMFLDGIFVGDKDYIERHAMLTELKLEPPPIIKDWKSQIHMAKRLGWEGFVLRMPGELSHFGYTLDGKAKRKGSYKYKFTRTDDFFVTEWEKGKSGRHASVYAKFHVAQYDDAGDIIDRGYVGPGTLTHEELEQLTIDLDSKTILPNFVVEIEFQDYQESGKLFFGVIQRMRPDKVASECISD